MAITKADLIKQAIELSIKVDPKAKMADIRTLIAEHDKPKKPAKKSDEPKEAVAKAGKRSAKALQEAESKEAKEDRKQAEPAKATKPPQKATRSRLERRAKGYLNSAKQLETNKLYSLDEAIKLAKTTSHVKFIASVELHVNLGVDPKHADQNIRDNVVLPAGSGQTLRVAVLTDDPAAATKAGADIAGNDDFIQKLDKGEINFDILIATPALMPKLGKYARMLGPKGLMPNPKSGTVTNDVEKAIQESKAGKVEYRVDPSGIIHLAVGKTSFEEAGLKDNVMTVMSSIRANKPSSVKSNYIESLYLATTMGPSIAVDLSSVN